MSVWLLSGRFVFVWVWFFPGGVRVLAEVISYGILLVLTVAAPGADYLDDVEAWVLNGCQGGGGRELGWLTLCLYFHFFTR